MQHDCLCHEQVYVLEAPTESRQVLKEVEDLPLGKALNFEGELQKQGQTQVQSQLRTLHVFQKEVVHQVDGQVQGKLSDHEAKYPSKGEVNEFDSLASEVEQEVFVREFQHLAQLLDSLVDSLESVDEVLSRPIDEQLEQEERICLQIKETLFTKALHQLGDVVLEPLVVESELLTQKHCDEWRENVIQALSVPSPQRMSFLEDIKHSVHAFADLRELEYMGI